jgi:hypothetical protein
LREAVYEQFNQLPGGEEWNFERENWGVFHAIAFSPPLP